MDFELTEEQKQLKETIYQFSKKEIYPNSSKIEYDHKGEFIWDNWKKMAKMGLLGFPFPEQYGGQGASVLDTVLAMEAFAMGGADSGTTLSWSAHTILCGVPIWQLGTEEQKQKYLTRIATGEIIGGFALTEPGAGSDAASVRTRAEKKGDRWILNGSKMFITNGPIGDVFVVIAVTDKSKKAFGISAFLVEKNFKGFGVARELDKLGNRTSPTAELYFEDCEVPEENLLGTLDMGFVEVAKLILEWERSCLLAPAVGGMELGLKRAVEYAKERKQFGRPIIEFEAIKRKIAEMYVAIEACRNLIYKVAWMKDNGMSAYLEASIAKYFVSETTVKMAYEEVQLFGGYGYMKEYLVERGYRDARLSTIGGGTSEVQKSIIARALLGLSGKEIT